MVGSMPNPRHALLDRRQLGELAAQREVVDPDRQPETGGDRRVEAFGLADAVQVEEGSKLPSPRS